MILPRPEIFKRGDPNPAAQRELEGVIRRIVARDGSGDVSHRLECRDIVCKVTVIQPTNEAPNVWLDAIQSDRDLISRAKAMDLSAPSPIKGFLGNRNLNEYLVYIQLRDMGGIPRPNKNSHPSAKR
jgi:hypothetical protein